MDQVDQFVAKYNGVHIDEDGYYGAQCWDVVARYAREVIGCPYFPTGSGGAEGLYRIFADPIPQYFDRIQGGYRKGDVIVWQASFSPPYGHTALCLDFDGTTLTVLEQNGNNPGGVAYIKQRSLYGVSGALRPKKGIDVANFTKEQEMTASEIATGSDPGKDYNYQFTVQDINSENLDHFLQFWLGQAQAHGVPKLQAQLQDAAKVISLKDGQIADQQKQIESLKAQTGDNSKWETLKALIRELVGISSTSN